LGQLGSAHPQLVLLNPQNSGSALPSLPSMQGLDRGSLVSSSSVLPRGSLLNPIHVRSSQMLPSIMNPYAPGFNVNVGLGGGGGKGQQPYYVQQVFVHDEKKKKKKKKKSDKEPEDKPVESMLGHYLDRQNQLMVRILRDIEDDKKNSYLREQALLNQQRFPYGRNSSYPPPGYPPGYMWDHPDSLNAPTRRFNSMIPQDPFPVKPFYPGESQQQSPKEAPKKAPPKKAPNRARGKKMLKSMLWGLALPGLWFLSIVKWAEQRRISELKILKDEIPENLETFLEFSASVVEKEVKGFINEKGSMILVQRTQLKGAELDRRCKTIADHLIIIIDHLSLQLDSGKLPPSFFEFLAALSEDDGVIPENFLSPFEIDRLNFNMFGNLKNMDEWRSKMVTACFILLKGVLYFLLLRPWTVMPSILEKSVNIKNILNAGSVLYHIVMDLLVEYIPEIHRSKASIPFKSVPPAFHALDSAAKLEKLEVKPDTDDNEADVIMGFYRRELLTEFLDKRPQMVKEVREAVLDFLDVTYDLTHNALEKKWHVKRRFAAEYKKRR